MARGYMKRLATIRKPSLKIAGFPLPRRTPKKSFGFLGRQTRQKGAGSFYQRPGPKRLNILKKYHFRESLLTEQDPSLLLWLGLFRLITLARLISGHTHHATLHHGTVFHHFLHVVLHLFHIDLYFHLFDKV